MTRPAPEARPAPLDLLLARWRAQRGQDARVRHIHELPATPARNAPPPPALGPQVLAALRARGLDMLYTHQAEAIERALEGRHLVLSTPTASGKSLCFHAPVLDALTWGQTALYLMPTRALAQDQAASLREWIASMPEADARWSVELYDGDTPAAERRAIRERATILITTPDMLHGAILPHHGLWRGLLARLEYIVVDELHLYRGVFGAHVANILRRLTRLCAHYEATPTFIGATATVANPAQLAERVFSVKDVALVDRSGAPSAARAICLIDPSVEVDGQAASLLEESARVIRQLGGLRLGTMAFVRSRGEVEALVGLLGGSKLRVEGYRGGHSAAHRRRVEAMMRAGELDVIVTTSALEVGIDVGGVDAVVIAGYPGTIASTWQQIGRAGRRGERALAAIVCDARPVDQFLLTQPGFLLARPSEHARLAPDSPRVVVDHLRCACHELPLERAAGWGARDGARLDEMMRFMRERGEPLVEGPRAWRWRGEADAYPAGELQLRRAPGARWRVEAPGGQALGEVDAWSAPAELWAGAAYTAGAGLWRIVTVDTRRRVAMAAPAVAGWRSAAKPIVAQEADVEEIIARGAVSGALEARLCWGRVVRRCVGWRLDEGEQEPQGPRAECGFGTQLVAFEARGLDGADERLRMVRRGLERVVVQAVCMAAMAEEADVIALWSQDEGAATLMLADAAPGGSGVAELCYEQAARVWQTAYLLVSGCRCARGCPACVGAPTQAGAWCKGDVTRWLERLAPRASSGLKVAKDR